MYQWGQLSDRDAEEVICDLLSAEWGVHVERFQTGADGGVDLRVHGPCDAPLHIPHGAVAVAQVKHYPAANLSRLRSAFQKEARREIHCHNFLYFAITTAPLSIHGKEEIAKLYGDAFPSSRIIGREDLESMLVRHGHVERRHFKLWFSSTLNLQRVLHAKESRRSRRLIQELARDSSYLVNTRDVDRARKILETEGSVILSGPPGVGKTSAAKILIGECVSAGWEPVVALNSIDEAEDVLDDNTRQVILYDDFLGASLRTAFLHGKNEDSNIVKMLHAARHSNNLRVILTTREYILASAKTHHQRLEDKAIDLSRIIMDTSDMTARERAEIIYRQVYFSRIRSVLHQSLAVSEWVEVIGHRNFNPRLSFFYIDRVAGLGQENAPSATGRDLARGLVRTFEEPLDLWKRIYDDQLSDAHRRVLQVISTFRDLLFDDAVTITHRYMQALGEPASKHEIRQAMRTIEGDFIDIYDYHDVPAVSFANASIGDYVALRLSADSESVQGLLVSAVTFSQVEVLLNIMSLGTSKSSWMGKGSVDGSRQISIDRLTAADTLTGAERELTGRAFVEAMLRLFSSGIYEFHPAYGGRKNRWETMPPLAAERRMKIVWDFVRQWEMEEEAWIPELLFNAFPAARIGSREGVLSNLWFTRGMANHSNWSVFSSNLIQHLRGLFYRRTFVPAHFAAAKTYASRYGQPDGIERRNLRLALSEVAWRLLDDLESGRVQLTREDIRNDVEDLGVAAGWLQVDLKNVLKGLRAVKPVVRKLPPVDRTREAKGDYSMAPVRIYPAVMSAEEKADAARILGIS